MRLQKAIKILEKREVFLAERIAKCLEEGVTPGYDLAERAAVVAALDCMRNNLTADETQNV